MEGLISGPGWDTDDNRTFCMLGVCSRSTVEPARFTLSMPWSLALMRIFLRAQQVDCLLVGRLISCAVGTIFS